MSYAFPKGYIGDPSLSYLDHVLYLTAIAIIAFVIYSFFDWLIKRRRKQKNE